MYIIRQFNLIGGKIDFQYVSSVEVKNGKFLIGYDAKKEYALDMGVYQAQRVEKEFRAIGCSFKTFENL